MKQILSKVFFVSFFLFVGVATLARWITRSWDWASLFFLISAVIFLGVHVFLNRELYRARLKQRSTKQGGYYFLQWSGLSAILFGLCVLAHQYPYQWDFSQGKSHTLSEASQKIAQSFKKPVTFYYFYLPDQASQWAIETVDSAFQMYLDVNPLLRLKRVNILKEPGLAKDFRLNNQEQGMFVEYGDTRHRFYGIREDDLTQALLQVQGPPARVFFTQGSGEGALNDQDSKGLFAFKKEMSRLSFSIKTSKDLSKSHPKPEDIIAVIGPQRALPFKTLERIKQHFEAGGALLIAFDPLSNWNGESLLKELSLEVPEGSLHMPSSEKLFGGSHMVLGVASKNSHPLTQELRANQSFIFYVSSAVKFQGSELLEYTPLLETTESAVLRDGFTNTDPVKDKGSFTLAALVESKEGPKGRAVVLADSDIFSNQFIYQQSNANLAFHFLYHLSKGKDLNLKKGLLSQEERFTVTDTVFRIYLILFIVPLPLLLFCVAGVLWARTRWRAVKYGAQ